MKIIVNTHTWEKWLPIDNEARKHYMGDEKSHKLKLPVFYGLQKQSFAVFLESQIDLKYDVLCMQVFVQSVLTPLPKFKGFNYIESATQYIYA